MTGLEMRYFVLNPLKHNDYGTASRKAIRAYAQQIETVNPQLATELNNWVDNIQTKLFGHPIGYKK